MVSFIGTFKRDPQVMADGGELCPVSGVTDKLFRSKTRIKKMRALSRIKFFLDEINRKKKVEKQGFREIKVITNLMDIKIRDDILTHNFLKKQHQDLVSL